MLMHVCEWSGFLAHPTSRPGPELWVMCACPGESSTFMEDVRKIALDFVYLAIGSAVGSFLQVSWQACGLTSSLCT